MGGLRALRYGHFKNDHRENLTRLQSDGYQILKVIESTRYSLIIFLEEGTTTLRIGIRIVTNKGVVTPDPVLIAKISNRNVGLSNIEVPSIIENHGFGSLMLSSLVKYTKQKDFNLIDGWIPLGDRDRFDKLKHFCEKQGFLVDVVNGKLLWVNSEIATKG